MHYYRGEFRLGSYNNRHAINGFILLHLQLHLSVYKEC